MLFVPCLGNNVDRELVKNVVWLLFDKVFPLGALFITNVIVARFLGAGQFGNVSYLMAVVSLLIPLCSVGLNSIITRELINSHRAEGEILGTCAALRLLSALLCLVVVFVSLQFVDFSSGSPNVLMMMLVSAAFQSLLVVEFWVNAREKNRLLVLYRFPALLLGISIKLLAVNYQAQAYVFALLWGLDIALQAVFIGAIYFVQKSFDWSVNWSYGISLVRQSGWLIFSGVATVFYLKLDQVMLGGMLGDYSVGIYTASTRLTEIWFFAPVALVTAAFPRLLKSKTLDSTEYHNGLCRLAVVLFYCSIVLAILISSFSGELIMVIYGQDYIEAQKILVIHIWCTVFVFLRALVSKWLIAENLLKYSLISHGSGAVLNIVLNFSLIPSYGVMGAAAATLISFSVSGVIMFLLFKNTRYIAIVLLMSPFPLRSRQRSL
jgi:O-antigen/teichoic acid export membrane protein